MANEVEMDELNTVEGEAIEVNEAETADVAVVEKEKLWPKVKRGAKRTWSKIPKPVKIGMGIVATSAAAFMLGKKVAQNSVEDDTIEEDDVEYDDSEFEEYVEETVNNDTDATTEEVSEEV